MAYGAGRGRGRDPGAVRMHQLGIAGRDGAAAGDVRDDARILGPGRWRR